MKMVQLKTGLGYLKDKDGHIISKFELSIDREHPFKDGYEIIEVGSQTELDKISLWRPPQSPESMIREEVGRINRIQAIKNLKAKGKIKADYKEE